MFHSNRNTQLFLDLKSSNEDMLKYCRRYNTFLLEFSASHSTRNRDTSGNCLWTSTLTTYWLSCHCGRTNVMG